MKKWVFALVIGVMMAIGAGADVSDDVIKCGSEIMGPGDVCEETRGGTTVETRTYDEMKESSEARARMFETWGRWALLGGGLVLAIAGLTGILATRRRRAAAAAQPQGRQPQFAPPQPMRNAPYQPNAPHVPHQQNASYPPNAPYPQQMPPQQRVPQQPYPQQPYPPQSFGPTGRHD